MNDRMEIEPRKHRRFQVPTRTFVVLEPHSTKVGRIIDISMGGLAFRYVGTEEQSNGPIELEIFSSNRDFYLGKIPFETISDFEIHENPFSPITMRRYSVQFGDLTRYQKYLLGYFIKNHTVAEMI